MPRKAGRKKRGGKKIKLSITELINEGNVHTPGPLFGSTTGAVTGCLGCANGGITIGSGCNLPTQRAAKISADRGTEVFLKGIRGQVGGGNTGEVTFKSLQDAARQGVTNSIPIISVQNCGKHQQKLQRGGNKKKPTPPSVPCTSDKECKTAVSCPFPGHCDNVCTADGSCERKKQGGGGIAATKACVNSCNNFRPAGYGLNLPPTAKFNSLVAGGGHAPLTPYSPGGQCIKRGGTRKRRKKRKRRRTKKNKKARKDFMKKYAHLISGLRKQRGANRRKTKGKRKTKRKRKRKTQRGGYAQYASNNSFTPGFKSPKEESSRPWATGPLSKSRQINCQNDYNHFTRRSSASPVTDKAAPRVPFGGTA